jgi:hypothetical protein
VCECGPLVTGAGRAQHELVASVARLQREWRDRRRATTTGQAPSEQCRGVAVLDLMPRHVMLTGPIVAAEPGIPLKSAKAALRDLVEARVLVEHGTVQPGRGRPSRLYVSAELLGLTGASPRRA